MLESFQTQSFPSLKSFYNMLNSNEGLSFPWKSIWKQMVRTRKAIFLWTMALGRIITMDNLGKQHAIVYIDVVCAKRVGRLPIICLVVVILLELRSMISHLLRILCVMPPGVANLLALLARSIWQTVPICGAFGGEKLSKL